MGAGWIQDLSTLTKEQVGAPTWPSCQSEPKPGPGLGTHRYKRKKFPDGKPIPHKMLEGAKLESVCAVRPAEVATGCYNLGVPFLISTPAAQANHLSVFCLDEFQALAQLPGVQSHSSVQCAFGAPSSRRTT